MTRIRKKKTFGEKARGAVAAGADDATTRRRGANAKARRTAPSGGPHATAAEHRRRKRRSGGQRPKAIAALDTSRLSFPKPKNSRSLAWAMREALRDLSCLYRNRDCGLYPVSGSVSLRGGDGIKAGFAGLQHCGSQSCPVCVRKIQATRAQELTALCQWAVSGSHGLGDEVNGGGLFVSMLTLTMRHHQGIPLKRSFKGLTEGWHAVTSGRQWQEFKEQLGVVGYVRAVELTHSEKNGWHLHQHILFLTRKAVESTPVVFVRKRSTTATTPFDFVAGKWSRGLAKNGFDFIPEKGMDWQTAKPGDAQKLGEYVAKMQGPAVAGIAREMTLSAWKTGRKKSRTPFEILADFLTTGDMADIELFREFEEASYNRRTLNWSRGLRELAKLGKEKTDQEIVDEDTGGETIAHIHGGDWPKVRAAGADTLLDIVDAHGPEAAIAWLVLHEIRFKLPDDSPPD